jgi:hypothetical protein
MLQLEQQHVGAITGWRAAGRPGGAATAAFSATMMMPISGGDAIRKQH